MHLWNTFPSHPSCSFLLEHIFILKTCIKGPSLVLAADLGLFVFFVRPFFSIMGRFGQITLIYLPSVSHYLSPPPATLMAADIDECQIHNGGCQHRCVNTRGSYYCECHPGSRLHVDGRTCLGEEQLSCASADQTHMCTLICCHCLWKNHVTQCNLNTFRSRV